MMSTMYFESLPPIGSVWQCVKTDKTCSSSHAKPTAIWQTWVEMHQT